MKVPPGTWTADTMAENANSRTGVDEERAEVDATGGAPSRRSTMNGASTNAGDQRR